MMGDEHDMHRPKQSSQLTAISTPGSMYTIAPGTDWIFSVGAIFKFKICMSEPRTSNFSGSSTGTTSDKPAIMIGGCCESENTLFFTLTRACGNFVALHARQREANEF